MDYLEIVEEFEKSQLRYCRIYQDRDKIEDFFDDLLKERFRMNKSTEFFVIDLLKDDIKISRVRIYCLSPIDQVLMALRYYGSGSYQNTIGDAGSISKSSVSRSITDVTMALNIHLNDFVHFPNHNVLQQNKQIFFNRHNFPGVIVAIDETHIRLYTCENQDSYRCRKGFLSINCQVVCGPDAKIYDVVARWP